MVNTKNVRADMMKRRAAAKAAVAAAAENEATSEPSLSNLIISSRILGEVESCTKASKPIISSKILELEVVDSPVINDNKSSSGRRAIKTNLLTNRIDVPPCNSIRKRQELAIKYPLLPELQEQQLLDSMLQNQNEMIKMMKQRVSTAIVTAAENELSKASKSISSRIFDVEVCAPFIKTPLCRDKERKTATCALPETGTDVTTIHTNNSFNTDTSHTKNHNRGLNKMDKKGLKSWKRNEIHTRHELNADNSHGDFNCTASTYDGYPQSERGGSTNEKFSNGMRKTNEISKPPNGIDATRQTQEQKLLGCLLQNQNEMMQKMESMAQHIQRVEESIDTFHTEKSDVSTAGTTAINLESANMILEILKSRGVIKAGVSMEKLSKVMQEGCSDTEMSFTNTSSSIKISNNNQQTAIARIRAGRKRQTDTVSAKIIRNVKSSITPKKLKRKRGRPFNKKNAETTNISEQNELVQSNEVLEPIAPLQRNQSMCDLTTGTLKRKRCQSMNHNATTNFPDDRGGNNFCTPKKSSQSPIGNLTSFALYLQKEVAPILKVGTKLIKSFGSSEINGQIVCMPETNCHDGIASTHYRVKFENGEMEEMNKEAVEQCVKQYHFSYRVCASSETEATSSSTSNQSREVPEIPHQYNNDSSGDVRPKRKRGRPHKSP